MSPVAELIRARVRGHVPSTANSARASVEAEEVLSRFFSEYVDQGRPGGVHLLREPRRMWAVWRALRLVPRLTAELSNSYQGRAIFGGLTHKTGFGRTPLHETTSVLRLPEAPEDYATGSSMQTLRRKSRAAERAGVRWARVDDPDERRRLITLSVERERTHPQPSYRWQDADNRPLLGLSLWLAAYTADGEPLLLAVVAVENEWAVLSYFRTLTDSPTASDTRYLMSRVLAEELVERRVRFLADTASPIGLPNGLRHFQRMLGYRIVRVRPTAERPA